MAMVTERFNVFLVRLDPTTGAETALLRSGLGRRYRRRWELGRSAWQSRHTGGVSTIHRAPRLRGLRSCSQSLLPCTARWHQRWLARRAGRVRAPRCFRSLLLLPHFRPSPEWPTVALWPVLSTGWAEPNGRSHRVIVLERHWRRVTTGNERFFL